MKRNALKKTASVVGIYASLLGIEHGVFEILQGDINPTEMMINAIGPPCQPAEVWHACFPALTVIPSFLWSGILTILISLSIMIWAVGFADRKFGGMVLFLLSILLLPVGGGFVPMFFGILAGITGTRIHAPLTWWKNRSKNVVRFFAALWPWDLILLVAWFPGSWIMGHFFGQVLLMLSPVLFFFFDLVLPILIVFSAIAIEAQRPDKGNL